MTTFADYTKALSDLRRAETKAERIRKVLAKNCHHPKKYVTPYQWEHDGGYGGCKWLVGDRCGVCGKQDKWRQGVWT